LGAPSVTGNRLLVQLNVAIQLKEASLCFTTDSGPWQQRKWQIAAAHLEGRQLSGELPSARPLVAFLAIKDVEGSQISSEHIELVAP